MQQPSKFAPVLISSVVMIILLLFPVLNLINLICCAGIIIGGASGTYYYAKQLDKAGQVIQNKDGIMIGLLSGIISAIIYVIFSTLITMIAKQNPVELVYEMTQQYGFNIPPETETILKQIKNDYETNGFSFFMIGAQLVSTMVSNCISGPLGGLLAASMYNKKKNQ